MLQFLATVLINFDWLLSSWQLCGTHHVFFHDITFDLPHWKGNSLIIILLNTPPALLIQVDHDHAAVQIFQLGLLNFKSPTIVIIILGAPPVYCLCCLIGIIVYDFFGAFRAYEERMVVFALLLKVFVLLLFLLLLVNDKILLRVAALELLHTTRSDLLSLKPHYSIEFLPEKRRGAFMIVRSWHHANSILIWWGTTAAHLDRRPKTLPVLLCLAQEPIQFFRVCLLSHL